MHLVCPYSNVYGRLGDAAVSVGDAYRCWFVRMLNVCLWGGIKVTFSDMVPKSVRLLDKPVQLVAGSPTTMRCVAEGSRPPAMITWFKDNRSFAGDQANPPVVTLTLGSTLNPSEIKEGDDVYFECAVRANPREHRISWYHHDRQVTQNMTSGIILSTRSLVLQKVTRQEAGEYSCRSANARGETSSESVHLRVQCKCFSESLKNRPNVNRTRTRMVPYHGIILNTRRRRESAAGAGDGSGSPSFLRSADRSVIAAPAARRPPPAAARAGRGGGGRNSKSSKLLPILRFAENVYSAGIVLEVHAGPGPGVRSPPTGALIEGTLIIAPVCAHRSPQVVGAALDEALRVRCSVHADPADVTFLWQFNNSGESFDVSPARYGTVNGSTSELRYTPASERDYGALTCRGTNAVGRQAVPCIFQIVPAARPSALRNCTLNTGNDSLWQTQDQQYNDWLVIRCIAGYDGGLPQHGVLEAVDLTTGMHRFNVTANETDGMMTFAVPAAALWPSAGPLRLTVHSRNDKGPSEKVTLNALAYHDPERRTDGHGSIINGVTTGIVWGVGLTLAVCVGASLAGVAVSRRKSRTVSKPQPPELQLNAPDGQYVVAYTLKPALHAQPDILNPPLDGDPKDGTLGRTPLLKNGAMLVGEEWEERSAPDALETHRISQFKNQPLSSQPLLAGPTALSRRELCIAEEIPGPESCV
ncbi:hypothetical protein EVAR_37783_1 [Eumeta japonica]|uniref:Ig-like domain-containing protein n=1 Tax=Eumeta variegata TaxID=151549 RepID=A0A4C1WQK4_EUMVA|nr:hypothetical protein EVAR_37783_1 [Eumeta japonica]